MPSPSYRRTALIACACFAVTLLAYLPLKTARILNQNDNFWYVPTAMSLLNDGDIELSEFVQPTKELSKDLTFLAEYLGEDDYRIFRTEDGRVLNRYPISTSIACVPVVAVLQLHYGKAENPVWAAIWMALLTAKIYGAATVGAFFVLAQQLTKRLGWSLLLTVILAFSSLNFGQHAGGLWSHNPASFYVVLALIALATNRSRCVWLAAFPLVFSVTMRPDVILLIAAATLFVFIHHRSCFWKYALVGAAGALTYVVFCKLNYDAFTQPYPGPVKVLGRDFARGMPGLLISPNRGLFVFMPLCVFSVWGLIHVFRSSKHVMLYRYLACTIVAHWLFLAVWPMWWAGWCFGPRLFCTLIPLWIIMLVPIIEQFKRVPVAVVAAACVTWGSFVQFRCLTDADVHLWNGMPVDVNDYTERLWDWGDLQITRGIGGEYGVDLPRKRVLGDYE